MYQPPEARPLAEVITNPVVDLLRRAKALITRREDWCSNGWGRDGARCALHALAATGHYNPAYENALCFLYEAVGDTSVGDYNDTHTHAEVLAKFDEAIALAIKKGR